VRLRNRVERLEMFAAPCEQELCSITARAQCLDRDRNLTRDLGPELAEPDPEAGWSRQLLDLYGRRAESCVEVVADMRVGERSIPGAGQVRTRLPSLVVASQVID
jgi:hypothetical protein